MCYRIVLPLQASKNTDQIRFPQTGVTAVLDMKRQRRWNLPINLTSVTFSKQYGWEKPDEILGRSCTGRCVGGCYGCPKTSSGKL